MDVAVQPDPKPIEHGGNLSSARTRFGDPSDGWVDLSTGINPNAYPIPAVPSEAWQRLPDQQAMDGLIMEAEKYYGLDQSMDIIATAGTQAIIQALPRLAPSARIAVISPTYGEHAHVWRTGGHRVVEVSTLDAVPEECSVAVVVNPNNPDGHTYGAADLLAVASAMHARGGFLVVDEAFCDVTPHLSLATQGTPKGLLILKSFGKFFGLAGLRLGFVAGDPALVARLDQFMGPWAVSGPALTIGAMAFADTDWVDNTRTTLSRDRQRLKTLLGSHGFTVRGATDLFVLVETEYAVRLYAHLGHAGILVRPYNLHPEWLRFGLPGQEQNWDRLEQALNSFI